MPMMRMPFLSLTAAALRNNGFDEPSLQETEQMLADALRNLTVQQRENVIEELHGVSTQAEIQAQDDKLKMMDLYFRLYANDAYRKAERQSKEYVEDPITRLAFLHATEDGGDPVEAAKKMVAYLEQKLILFGEHALCRPITLNDLNDDSMNCLRSGFFQYLGKDNVGRKVVASFPSALVYGDIENHVRMGFYFFTTLFPTDEIHDRGLIWILYHTETDKRDLQLAMRGATLFASLPIKISAFHITLNPRSAPLQDSMPLFFLKLFGQFVRARASLHFGSHLEVQYELKRFGINTNEKDFPVTFDGRLRVDCHLQWIEERRRIEQAALSEPMTATSTPISNYSADDQSVPLNMLDSQQPSSSTASMVVADVIENQPPRTFSSPQSQASRPSDTTERVFRTPHDVLLGRGIFNQNYSGNVAYRELLNRYYADYDRSDATGKLVIIDFLHHELSRRGVRFLRGTADGGYVVEHNRKAIREKMGSTFRSLRKLQQQQQQQQQQQH